MDQEKTGKFIARRRKEKGFTQAALGERLGVTDRAVSKWERGLCLPDAALMLPNTRSSVITVNELLTGEEVVMEDYKAKAEQNLLELRRQEEENNRALLRLETVIGCLGAAAGVALILAGGLAVEALPLAGGAYRRGGGHRGSGHRLCPVHRARRRLLPVPPLREGLRAHPKGGGPGPAPGAQSENALPLLRAEGLPQKSPHPKIGKGRAVGLSLLL